MGSFSLMKEKCAGKNPYRSLQFLNYIRPKQITLKNGLTYEPTGMSAGNFRLAENQLSD